MAKSKNKKRSITELTSRLKIFSASDDSFDLIKEGEKIQSGFLDNAEHAKESQRKSLISNVASDPIDEVDNSSLKQVRYGQMASAVEEVHRAPAVTQPIEQPGSEKVDTFKRVEESHKPELLDRPKNLQNRNSTQDLSIESKSTNISFKKFHEGFETLVKKLREDGSSFTIDAKFFNFCLEKLDSPAACVLYIYIYRLVKLYGDNGESISVSLSSLAKAVNFSKGTIRTALKKLEEHALVKSENLISSNIYTIKLGQL